MNDHTRAATLEEWMDAALTMAEVNGMSDDTVIPTWPADVVERAPGNHPQLTVGALRQWKADQHRGEPYVLTKSGMFYAYRSQGYVSRVELAELYSKQDANSHARSCEEVTARPVTDFIDDAGHIDEVISRLERMRNAIAGGGKT